MNTKQFVVDLLSSYPEVMRPQDKAYLITIERNISDLALSGEVMRSILKRIVASESRFPAWATIKQWADVVCNEQRSMSSHKVSHDEYARWKLESCSLDEAMPYMVSQLIDSGEMSRELLGAITGKWEALGIRPVPGSTYPAARLGEWAAAGSLLPGTLPLSQVGGPVAARGPAAADADPGHSSISALDISRGGTQTNTPFPQKGPAEQSEGLLDVLCEGPGKQTWTGLKEILADETRVDQPLDRCGSCGKYFLRSSHCSCIADYDDSERLEDL